MNEEKQVNQLGQCPSFEELSLWLDGELRNESVQDHIQNCSRCQKQVQFFKMADSVIEHHLNDSVLPGLSDRILQKISLESASQNAQTSKYHIWMLSMHVAAIILVLLAGGFWYMQMNSSEIVAEQTPTNISNLADSTIPLERLSPVHFSDQNSLIDMNSTNLIHLETNISQSWLVNQIEQSQKMLKNWAESEKCNFKITQSAEKEEIQIQCTVSQLDRLVNLFVQSGYKLLTNTNPQPGQYFSNDPTEKINYKIQFIEN